jgi:hypothetical protein
MYVCRRQFLRKMWPIQLAFRFLISRMIFLCSLTLNNTSSFLTWSVQLIFSILLQHQISKLSRYFWSAARSVQVSIHNRKSEEEYKRRGKKKICKKERLKEQTAPSTFKLRYMHAMKANCSSVQYGTNIVVHAGNQRLSAITSDWWHSLVCHWLQENLAELLQSLVVRISQFLSLNTTYRTKKVFDTI